MRSYKALLNEAVNHSNAIRPLTDKESKALKSCILDIYKKVSKLCDNHCLTYMLAGGSCLGAVRHQGYIPWDDDIDILMPRPDYEKLILLCEQGMLGKDYEFRHPRGDEESMTMFLKLYLKDTELVDLINECLPFPRKVCLDVFPLDGYSNSSIIRRYKGLVANCIRLIANLVNESSDLSKTQKVIFTSNSDLWNIVRVRRIIGKFFSIIPHKCWVRWFDSFVKNPDMTGLIGIPTGRKLYGGEVFPASYYMPPVDSVFEGIDVKLPAKTHEYLENLFHDYMEIPSVENRESHFIIDLKLPEKYHG